MRANPRKYLRYAQIQAKYQAWCRDKSVDHMDPSGISVLNFLAEGHSRWQWSINTLNCYRSAILDLFSNRDEILSSYALKSFFQAVLDQSVRNDQSRPVDISPVLAHCRSLGSNDTMALADLSAKLCWLLGVCGFMRPSDIERIDLSSINWTSQ